MGEPDSMSTEDVMRHLALDALGPGGRVSARILRETGLHREFLQLHFRSIQPEIKDLVGWKKLHELRYHAHYRADNQERRHAEAITKTWLKVLDEHGLSDEHAVQIYDGELHRLPAPDYRLFVLRDGRVLYYAGGFRGSSWKNFTCGDVLDVLDVLDKRYSAPSCSSPAQQPFIIILQALTNVFEVAIKHRERKVQEQRTRKERLNYAIRQVSAK